METLHSLDSMANNQTEACLDKSTIVINTISNTYNQVMVGLRDPRADGWFLMSSIWPTIALSTTYYVIVRHAGPKLMENREPYNLKYVMLGYNLFQTVFNTWLFYKVWWLWRDHYSWACQPVDYSNSHLGLAALDVTWWYFFSKFIDFFDSFFFVLRKKFSHLSTLHVVHHGGLPIAVWFGPRFVGGGHTTFCGFLNCAVHVAMYLYYFLAALGPRVQPYLWWKRYLTKLQMIQFIIFFIHAMQPLFIECDYPKEHLHQDHHQQHGRHHHMHQVWIRSFTFYVSVQPFRPTVIVFMGNSHRWTLTLLNLMMNKSLSDYCVQKLHKKQN